MLTFIGMIRIILFAAILMSATAIKAQTTSPDIKYPQPASDTHNIQKKWFFTKYAGVSAGFVAFKGGSGNFLSVPLALQVNRQLTNNLYAFGGVSMVPYLFHYNSTSYQPNKNSSFMQTNNVSTYSDAKIGMMYINNERTFSISGSIGVSRGSYNSYSPFYSPVYSPILRNNQ
jgi:hypothetical protein